MITLFHTSAWAWVALGISLLIIGLPLPLAIGLLGVTAFLIVAVVEPMVAFIALLTLAPLKSLMEAKITLPVDIGQLMLVLAVGIWLAHKIAHRHTFVALNSIPLFLPILLFLTVVLFTLPNAYSIAAGINECVKWLEILILLYIVIDIGKLEWFVFAVVFAGAIQAIIGIYEFQGGSGAPHLWILNYQYFRAFGTFGQPNPFGAFMGLTLSLALGTTWGYLTKAWQDHATRPDSLILTSIYGAFSLIILIGLFASWSRGAWLGFAAATITLLWLLPRRRWQGALLFIGLGAILWLSQQIPPQIANRVTDFSVDFSGFGDVRGTDISDENYAVVERLAHWQSAREMAKSRPWLGVGFGNYEIAYPDFALINWPLALGHAHNYYLNLLAETGIVGLTFYVIMWGIVLRTSWQVLDQSQLVKRGIALGLIGAWVHLAVHSLVDKIYVNNIFLHIGVMLGLLASLRYAQGTVNGRNNFTHHQYL